MTQLLAPLALALALVAGCGEPNQLDSGTVVDRNYDDPDLVPYSVCVGYDSHGFCRVWSTQYSTDSASWSLQIVGYGDDGKERTEWHDVTESDYDRHPVGSRWGVG